MAEPLVVPPVRRIEETIRTNRGCRLGLEAGHEEYGGVEGSMSISTNDDHIRHQKTAKYGTNTYGTLLNHALVYDLGNRSGRFSLLEVRIFNNSWCCSPHTTSS